MPCLRAFFGDLCIYIRIQLYFDTLVPKYILTFILLFILITESVGKLTATIVNLINFLGGWLACEYTDRLTAVDIHRGGTIK